jgi:outer membrane protein
MSLNWVLRIEIVRLLKPDILCMPLHSWKKKEAFLSLMLLGSAFICSNSHAETLSALLELAISNEPTYLGAKAAVQTANARTDQALGGLLPQINVSVTTNYNDRDYQQRSTTGAQDRYNSDSEQVNLTQPIWRQAYHIGLEQAESAVSQAEQQLENAEQELLTKLVSAWFDLLGARDQVIFLQQQINVSQHLKEVAQRGFELGYIGQPELDDVSAKLELVKADQVAAETDLNLKQAAVEQIIGNHQLTPTFMRKDAELANLSKARLEDMLANVESGNHNIRAAMHAYKAATDEVDKQNAGHLPTLDLVASYGKNSQAVGGFPGQPGYDIKQGTVGLQLNVPIYSGGTQSAKAAEAVAQKEKARLDIEAARRAAILAAKQAWYGWHAVFTKARAFEQAMKAANTALKAATVAENNGLESEIKMLEAQQKLSEAQRDYNKSRYEQVVNLVKLKTLMGVLTHEDITALDTLLVEKTADTGILEAGAKEQRDVSIE